MNELKFTGIVTFVSKEEIVWDKKIPKMYIVLEEEDKEYPSSIRIEFYNSEKVMMVRAIKVGELHTVLYNTRVNEHWWKHYMSANARKLVKRKKKSETDFDDVPSAKNDDLPF